MITDFARFDECFIAEWVIGNGHCLRLSDLHGIDEKLSANAEGQEGRGGNQASDGSKNRSWHVENPPPHGHQSVLSLLYGASVLTDEFGQLFAFTISPFPVRRVLKVEQARARTRPAMSEPFVDGDQGRGAQFEILDCGGLNVARDGMAF